MQKLSANRASVRKKNKTEISINPFLAEPKETKLERADFAFQLLMFVAAEKEGQLFIIFFLSIFCQLLSPRF